MVEGFDVFVLKVVLCNRGLIVLRQSFDWSAVKSIDALKPEDFDKKVHHPLGTTRRSIMLWNQIFKKNFFEVRHELKGIAMASFKVAKSTDLEASSRRYKISKWRPMLLTDDDDWVNPNWLDYLPSPLFSRLKFCRWQSLRFNGDFYVRPNSKDYSFTNNYCVYPSARSDYSFISIYQHFDQTLIHDSLSFPEIDYIDIPLTITHKHPASANVMRQLLTGSAADSELLYNSVIDYVKKISSLKIPDECLWANKMIESSYELFNSIVV